MRTSSTTARICSRSRRVKRSAFQVLEFRSRGDAHRATQSIGAVIELSPPARLAHAVATAHPESPDANGSHVASAQRGSADDRGADERQRASLEDPTLILMALSGVRDWAHRSRRPEGLPPAG
jgi:hypothetical protein